jgi:hypothetical protein
MRQIIHNLSQISWLGLSSTDTSFLAHGNTFSGLRHLIIGIHSLCTPTVEPLCLKSPPPSIPRPLGLSIWEPFNQPKHSVLLAKEDYDFMRQDVGFTKTLPKPTLAIPPGVLVKYFLHEQHSEESMLASTAVVLSDGLCPPFDARPNKNMFQHLLGIKFHYENHSHVRGILPFEFSCCYGFNNNLTYWLSQPANKFCLDAAVPGHTLEWLLKQVHAHLTYTRDSNCEIFSPNQFAAPAATIQAFVDGAIRAHLPSHN